MSQVIWEAETWGKGRNTDCGIEVSVHMGWENILEGLL